MAEALEAETNQRRDEVKARLLRKKILIPSVAVFLVAGAAIAAWVITSQGQGGKGNIGSLSAPTVSNPTTSSAAPIYPGQSGDFEVQVTNPNSSPLVLTGWTPQAGTLVTIEKPAGTPNSACSSTTPVTLNTVTGKTIQIPVGTTTVTLPGAWNLDPNAGTSCAGSVVSVNASNAVTYTFNTP